ncbi:MAG: hypothetical protein KKH72_06340 [Alphaproteobacteria bacterium]|nr:hypothetical protein [Alphaproteobacteria bacterium]
MKRISTMLVMLAGLMPAAALAQGNVIAQYGAYLGSADHYNSNGAQLSEPWQVIRQDRANFHKFGIQDQWDEWDGLFANANNRAKLERLLVNAGFTAAQRRTIVDNEVFINVTVFGYGSNITGVQVDMP